MKIPPVPGAGNAAKLYCLRSIEALAHEREDLRVIDLGSGSAANFAALLGRHPHIEYVGIDPSPAACDQARSLLRGHQAEIHCMPAYDVRLAPADVVVSFSVLEHVYDRPRYIQALAEHVKPGGAAYVNYDAGHFFGPGTPRQRIREHVKTLVGGPLARLGRERYFQAFVREADFQRWIAAAGLVVEDAKSLNTVMKEMRRLLPEDVWTEYDERWLDHELWMNANGLRYEDKVARTFRTRNFVLRHPA